MKSPHSLIISAAALTCAVGLAFSVPSLAAPRSSADQWHEQAELRITKIYSAKDGAATFNGYVVIWKGQEVVVNDSMAKWDFRVGDTIPVLVFRSGSELRFEINPQGKVKNA